MSSRTTCQLLLLLCITLGHAAKATNRQCCNGKPCGDTCISLTRECLQPLGSASCKRGNGCSCESIAGKAWTAWKRMPKDPPKHKFKEAIEPLVGDKKDPWMLGLYNCFADGALTAQQCIARSLLGKMSERDQRREGSGWWRKREPKWWIPMVGMNWPM